jgi:hypothetical protein
MTDGQPDLHAQGEVIVPMATAAMLDSAPFARINPYESSIPIAWEDRAKKAWEYYVEEPLVKNCINSWRTFAVGDEIRITSDDDAVKTEASDLADRLDVSEFVKDMILQLLVKGDAVGFKRYTKDGKDIEESHAQKSPCLRHLLRAGRPRAFALPEGCSEAGSHGAAWL